MSDDGQTTEDSETKGKARNSPKHTKETWLKVRTEFEAGTYTSLVELAHKYGIHWKTMESRMRLEGWRERKQVLLSKVNAKVQEKVVGRVEQYLSRLTLRAEKYEKMLDASIAQQSQTNEGIPQCDADQLDVLTRAELRVVEMNKVGLRLAPPSVDITSKGLSVGESIVTAIQKLRDNPSAIVPVSSADVDRVLEMEVVDEQKP